MPRRAESSEPAVTQMLPMDLRVGDHLTDDTGEWEVIGRPFSTAAGKNAHARVRKVGQPELTDLRTWSAHQHLSVKRTASPEEGKR